MGSLIPHARPSPRPVRPLVIPVVEPSFRTLAMPPPRPTTLLPARRRPTPLRAVPLSPIATPADPEHRGAPPARPLP